MILWADLGLEVLWARKELIWCKRMMRKRGFGPGSNFIKNTNIPHTGKRMGKELNSIKSLNIDVFSFLSPHFIPIVLPEQSLVFVLKLPFIFLNLRW